MLSADERQIYYTLSVLSIVEDLLTGLFFSSPQFMDPESELPMTIDAGTVLEISDVWSFVQMPRKHLIGIDKRRQLWSDAAGCLHYNRAADFRELHVAIMAHVTAGRWAPHFCKAVLAEFRDLTLRSRPSAFAAWQRTVADRRPQGDPLTSPIDESSGLTTTHKPTRTVPTDLRRT